MKEIKSYILLLAIIFSIVSFSFSQKALPVDTPKYIGVEKCAGACHKSESQGKQLEIWKGSKHSEAYKILETAEADKVAKDNGFTTPAKENLKCLRCHSTNADTELSEETFNIKDGVQCETCHGPGSIYKTISMMKDKRAAKENGLVVHKEKEKFCTGCHNSNSPTFKGFNYDEYWEKVKHMRPASE